MKMKKTFLTAVITAVLARWHGCRCFNALAGVFAKQKLQRILLAGMLIVFASCGSGPKASGSDELDVTIREASDYLNNNIPAGSKIVILNVQSGSAALSDYIINELIANAVNDKIFSVVDRQQLDLIRAEQNFQFSGEVGDDEALAIGKFFGAQSIVSGALSPLGSRNRLTVRALEVQTAQVQGQFNRNIDASATIADLMRSGGGSSGGGTATAAGSQTSGGSATASGGTAQAATPARPAAPQNGTYYFYPRPRATVTGVNVNVYLDSVVVRGGYFTIYFSSTPQGYREGYYGDGGTHFQITAWSRRDTMLQDLDNPRLTWQAVNAGVDPETKATFTTFQGVTARRFSLTSTWDDRQVFEEINLNNAEYEP